MRVEAEVIARSSAPATSASLEHDLINLGLATGATVIVHSSLSSIGWIVGGADAVIDALLGCVGRDGTVMVPAHSAQLTDPATWENPPVPQAWWPTIRDAMPAYDPERTPTAGMGIIPETFRRLPGMKRSWHPTASFAARGPLSDRLLEGQTLDDGLGESSPLARLYDTRGWVLLLGVGHDRNTSLHLAQYRAVPSGAAREQASSPMLLNGIRTWITYSEHPKDSDDFPALGLAFETASGVTRIAKVGSATARLMPIVDLVDFATTYLSPQPPSG